MDLENKKDLQDPSFPFGEEDQENPLELKAALEAMLFIYGGTVTAEKLQQALSEAGYKITKRKIQTELDQLLKEYQSRKGGIMIEKVAGGYRMSTPPHLAPVLTRLQEERRKQKLSAAAIETLAIIAYKQPITRSEIENIRGVGAGNIVRNLAELGLVEVKGRSKEQRGAYLHGTTEKFLEIFGLNSLEDLPQKEGYR